MAALDILIVSGNPFVLSEMNPGTGVITELSSPSLGTGEVHFQVSAIVVEKATGDVYVLSSQRKAIFKVAIATGNRTVIAGLKDDGTLQGTGDAFLRAVGMTQEADGDLVVADIGNRRILNVKVATGNRTTLGTLPAPDGLNQPSRHIGIEYATIT